VADFDEIQKDYGVLMGKLRDTIGEKDPRSFNKALERMEESLHWASKGYFSDTDHRSAKGSSNEQQ